MTEKNLCASIYRYLTTFFTTLILIPVLLILTIFFVPFITYRWFISKLGPLINSDYGKILTAIGSYFGAECDHIATRTCSTFCSSMKIAGHVTVEQFRKDLMEKVIVLKTSNGEHKYPELQQYYEKFMGYVFFKWDRNFNIENHVRYYSELPDEPPVDEDTFASIRRGLAEKPFQENKSPWEIVILKNFKRSDDTSDTHYSVLFLRFHHGLVDGFSFTKLLLTTGVLHTKVPLDFIGQKVTSRNKRNPLIKFFASICNVMIMPFKVIHHVRNSRDEYNYFHRPQDQLSRAYCSVEGKVISMNVVKEIQQLHQVSYTSVVFAAFGGAIRNYMLEKKFPVPDVIRFGSPIALKGHPSKLRNHATGGLFKIPLGITDPIVRLKKINEHFYSTTKSKIAVYLHHLGRIVLILPVSWTKSIVITGGMTLGISTLPGPKCEIWYNDSPITEIGSSIASGRNEVAFGSSIVSYKGGFNIALGGNKSIFNTKEDVKHLSQLIEREFEVLKYYNCNTNTV